MQTYSRAQAYSLLGLNYSKGDRLNDYCPRQPKVLFGMRNIEQLTNFAKDINEGMTVSEASMINGVKLHRAYKFIHRMLAHSQRRGLEPIVRLRPFVPKSQRVKKEKIPVYTYEYRSARQRLNINQVLEIKSLIASGLSNYKIAAKYGVSAPTIGLIRHGSTWGDVTN